MAKAGLTQRQRIFITEYFKTFNAEKAAIKAGYAATTARKKSFAWVGKSRDSSSCKAIWDAVQEKLEKLEKEHGVTQERILHEYKKLAFYDVRKLFDVDGNLISIHELDDDTAAVITGMDIQQQIVRMGDDNFPVKQILKKIKLVDKKGALDSLAKIKGMFAPKKHEVTGKDGGPIETQTTKLTNFPKEPETLAEWEKQVKEADDQRKSWDLEALGQDTQ